ncbi:MULTISPECIES: alpha-amylase family glycosyl hydrolase [unclassified Chelatococcus]|uniref:alpha-amylase family glycosyl hydrolase n=1 Tax=unclassified Chelatococcus TaxID=2638111 RepID=UPI001BD1A1B3|nr:MULTISPECIES: alpha-amylase family glycosyl hydrolase [unclassified Chelatococcus]MBS7700072.1 DUF3459 domain-containing protein [Chelatococcus sp. YT9]MBX3556765.1 DUF3459 domain-containing protein [Chelatococcus sp.]
MKLEWWQRAVIYQIYPRSFQDSDGDGIGDLRGITSRLPYLVELGIDAIWLSPIFSSPMNDFGYDISDYTAIDPIFGSLSDLDQLLAAAHDLGLKVILDLVPNHTSDQHAWFKQSRSSRVNQKRDWYIWRDPSADGGVPNNWQSEFGGPAWEFDQLTGQYYYHAFLPSQPDLNWRNVHVREAIYDVMRYWLRRGVDGFRIDVIWHLIKDDQFRDNPPNPDFGPGRPPHEAVIPLYTTDRPEIHDVISEMRRVVDPFPGRLLIGEIYLPIERLVAYYGHDLSGVHLPFNFALLNTPWDAEHIARLIDTYEAAIPPGGWPNWVLGNHDRPRVATRVGEDQAPLAATLLLTLRGTPTIYYGEELGMQQVPIGAEDIQDPFERNVPGLGVGRDGCRTPMQWDASRNAGFTSGEPWLPVSLSFRDTNVESAQRDPGALLQLYRALIRLRRSTSALVFGNYRPISIAKDILVYAREYAGERVVVALNFGSEAILATLWPYASAGGRILLSSRLDRRGEMIDQHVSLRGHEALVIELGLETASSRS